MLQQFFLDHEGTSIYQIPPEVWDEIMLRVDAFEVSMVRVAVQEFRGALTYEQFVQRASWRLDDLLNDVVIQGDAFDLLCSNGSYFLFSRTRFRPRSFDLIVVNITSGYVMVIDCPYPIGAHALSFNRESIKLNLEVVANDLSYEIVHVLEDHQALMPVLCVYNSILEEWIFIKQATLLARHPKSAGYLEQLDVSNDITVLSVQWSGFNDGGDPPLGPVE
ncbi:hypothetical protein Tco_0752942 [Tanacetum coccineum]